MKPLTDGQAALICGGDGPLVSVNVPINTFVGLQSNIGNQVAVVNGSGQANNMLEQSNATAALQAALARTRFVA